MKNEKNEDLLINISAKDGGSSLVLSWYWHRGKRTGKQRPGPASPRCDMASRSPCETAPRRPRDTARPRSVLFCLLMASACRVVKGRPRPRSAYFSWCTWRGTAIPRSTPLGGGTAKTMRFYHCYYHPGMGKYDGSFPKKCKKECFSCGRYFGTFWLYCTRVCVAVDVASANVYIRGNAHRVSVPLSPIFVTKGLWFGPSTCL